MTVAMNFRKPLVAVALVVFLFAVLDIGWRLQSHDSSEVIFQNSLEHNLTETGLTCTTADNTGAKTLNQAVSLDLVSKNKLHANITSVPKPSITIKIEEISVPSGTFARYTSINTTEKNAAGNTPDFSNVLNQWSKTVTDNQKTSLFGLTALGNCIVPLAHLSEAQTAGLRTELGKNTIFKTNSRTAKSEVLNGIRVRTYDVTVQPRPYIDFMKQVAKLYGLHDLDTVKSADFDNKTPETMKFYVDPDSQRLLKIASNTRKRTVTFSDFGKIPNVSEPKSYIAAEELEKRLTGQ